MHKRVVVVVVGRYLVLSLVPSWVSWPAVRRRHRPDPRQMLPAGTVCGPARAAGSMGSRLLKRWLNRPLRNISIIKGRQQAVHGILEAHQFDALYHSRHGAIGESDHVFIQAGLEY